ncbi:RDD family protein [Paenibacillus lentus]|uniref:RDD family protein n=1 Tax=Paenibacillus lentus TaxID=1338368 RepID=UPI003667D290
MYARFWKRAVAALLDLLVVASIHQVIGILSSFAWYWYLQDPYNYYEYLDELIVLINVTRGILLLVVFWHYFTIMESSRFQATFGKMAMGLRVVNQEGKRITFHRATARFWSKSFSAFTVLIGWFMAGFTKKKQALHDIVAGTCLIEEETLKARQMETAATV